VLGGVEWNGASYDAASETIYVGAVDWCATFVLGVSEKELAYTPGQLYFGTAFRPDTTEPATGWVTAVDGGKGAVRWKYHTPSPVVAGLTTTAGGLLFTGDLAGNFYAFSKTSGDVLLNTKIGGAIAGGVITYAVGGRQYVATTSGNVSRATWGTTGTPKIVVMVLDGPERGPLVVALPEINSQGTQTTNAGSGQQAYEQYCAGCHGTRGEGLSGPNLTSPSARHDLAAIVEFIKNPKPPMPDLHPSPLDDAEVTAIGEYVRTLQTTGDRR
jgi:mono/diheme cytochrome c family protein